MQRESRNTLVCILLVVTVYIKETLSFSLLVSYRYALLNDIHFVLVIRMQRSKLMDDAGMTAKRLGANP